MSVTYSGDAATTRTSLGLGDAATKTTGTASGNIPVLDSSGQIADAQIAALSVSKLSGVGTTGQVLTSTGTTTAPTMQDAAGGKLLQVVHSNSSGTNTIWGSLTSAPGASITITPVAAGSKLMYVYSVPASGYNIGGDMKVEVHRDGSYVHKTTRYVESSVSGFAPLQVYASVIESPTYTLSASITYDTKVTGGAGTLEINKNVTGNRTVGYIMEFGA